MGQIGRWALVLAAWGGRICRKIPASRKDSWTVDGYSAHMFDRTKTFRLATKRALQGRTRNQDITVHPHKQAGHFSSEIAGVPASVESEVVELSDGDRFDLRIAAVAKRIGDATVRMLAYNGSIPGPMSRKDPRSLSPYVTIVRWRGQFTGMVYASRIATMARTKLRLRFR